MKMLLYVEASPLKSRALLPWRFRCTSDSRSSAHCGDDDRAPGAHAPGLRAHDSRAIVHRPRLRGALAPARTARRTAAEDVVSGGAVESQIQH